MSKRGQIFVTMDPRSRRELRKLIRVMDRGKSLERAKRGLVLDSAGELCNQLQGELRDAGHGDLADSVRLVESGDSAGVAVLPKEVTLGLGDIGATRAVYVFPRSNAGDFGWLLNALAEGSPWTGKTLMWLPPEQLAVVVVREVTESEVARLDQLGASRVADIRRKLESDKMKVPESRSRIVIEDVGFSGVRAEHGIGRDGVIGLWRKQARSLSKGLSPGMREKLERVLFDGGKWNLTHGGSPVKMKSSELEMVRRFQDEIS